MEAIRAKTPTGARYITQMTSFIITSLRPSKNRATVLPCSPMVVKAIPNRMLKTMIGSRSRLAADLTRLVLTSDRTMSLMPAVSPLVTC